MTYCEPLHIEHIQDTLSRIHHPVVLHRHVMALFDLGLLIAIIAENKLYRVPRELRETKEKGSKGRVHPSLCMRMVPLSLLALFKPPAAEHEPPNTGTVNTQN
jgi:hypothetical protein